MKDYKQLLKELPSNTVVCALGDFDPPTVGHELLIKTVKRLAESKGSAHVIFTSPSKTLQEDKKSQYLKLMFPKTNFTSIEESFASSVEQLKKKYKNVIVVVGSEQSTGLKKALKESVEFVAITEKNPDADTSKMKSYATKALYEEFKKKLPSSIRELDGRRLMNDVRTGMGLEPVKEQLNLVKDTLREQYFRGEIFKVGDVVESNGAHYTIVKRGSNHLLLKEESGELVSKWIQDVKSINEGAIQPSGTDQVIPAGPDKVDAKDQNGNPNPKDKGLKKGYLTFYNYTKDKNDFKVAKMEQYQPHSVSDTDKDSESDLDADKQKLQVFDPTEVGNAVNPNEPKGAHHLRRMKLKYAFKEHVEKSKNVVNEAEQKHELGIDHDEPMSRREHIMSTIAKHGGKITGQSDKSTYVHFPAEKVHAARAELKAGRVHASHWINGEFHESVLNPNDPHGDYKAKSKVIQDIQMDPNTHKDPELKKAVMQRKADLDKEYSNFKESLDESYDEAEKHLALADKAQRNKDMYSHHMHMADYHDAIGQWHDSKGRSNSAANHFSKAEQHEMMAQSHKKSVNEAKKKEAVCPKCGKHECECGEERPQTSKEMNPTFDPFFKEEDLSDKEIDKMIEAVSDEEIEGLYEEEELTVIYEDTGEELPIAPEEAEIELMEVLSRQERMKAKFRFRKTAAKRERSTKIALKRYSNTATINKRARRLAIKLMKSRLLRGRDLSTVSVQEKERIEKAIANRKNAITRIAAKLVGRIRRVEKSRMSHGQITKGTTPSVF